MDNVTVLGLSAAALTIVAFFPQLLKVWRTRSTRDISLEMFLIFCVAVFLWFIYGVLTNDVPVIVANFLVFIQASIILALKAKYK